MTGKPDSPSNTGPAAKLSSDPPEKRVFVNDKGDATFICPACNKGVIRDMSDFTHIESAVRLKCKCSCGHVYRVLVERRRHFRKPVNLMGRFFFQGPKGKPGRGLIRVRNISQSGIQFSINTEPEFKVGDKLTIEFTLDDGERSQIREEGVVRRIKGNVIGLAFHTTDHYGQLGKYLFR